MGVFGNPVCEQKTNVECVGISQSGLCDFEWFRRLQLESQSRHHPLLDEWFEEMGEAGSSA